MSFKMEKVLFLGDSITEGAGASSLSKRFTDVFAQKTGVQIQNYGIGGTRIARKHLKSPNPRVDDCFLDRLERMDGEADLVVIFGGTNDFGHGDAPLGEPDSEDEYTFYGAMRHLLQRAIEKYPEARIVVLTPLHRTSECVTVNEIGLPTRPLKDFVDAEIEVSREFSIPVLDLWSVSGIQPRVPAQCRAFSADGLHPNDRGHERIADCLIRFLETLG